MKERAKEQPFVPAPEVAFVTAAREEIDGYFVGLKQLGSMDPADVFLWLSGVTARLVELRMICFRNDTRRMNALRSRELDPLIEQCDRAFRLHSRVQSCRQVEYDAFRNVT